MNGPYTHSIKLTRNFTYGTLLNFIDCVKTDLDAPGSCPMKKFAGVMVPVSDNTIAVRQFKTCSFDVPLKTSIPINWRCYCARKKSTVILQAGSTLTATFVDDKNPWTQSEIDKIILILLEINSEN
jgi:hypothetical protein